MVECLFMADSASSTKAPEANIREDWDELANDRKGRRPAGYQCNMKDTWSAIPDLRLSFSVIGACHRPQDCECSVARVLVGVE